jgi:hypothetical protein
VPQVLLLLVMVAGLANSCSHACKNRMCLAKRETETQWIADVQP